MKITPLNKKRGLLGMALLFHCFTGFPFCISYFLQKIKEPSVECQPELSATTIQKSGSSGMIQYLQSWFPGWGGWYGDSENLVRPEEPLPSPSSWSILGQALFLSSVPAAHRLFYSLLYMLNHDYVLLSSRDRRPVWSTGGLPHSEHLHQAGSHVCPAGVLTGEGYHHALWTGQEGPCSAWEWCHPSWILGYVSALMESILKLLHFPQKPSLNGINISCTLWSCHVVNFHSYICLEKRLPHNRSSSCFRKELRFFFVFSGEGDRGVPPSLRVLLTVSEAGQFVPARFDDSGFHLPCPDVNQNCKWFRERTVFIYTFKRNYL